MTLNRWDGKNWIRNGTGSRFKKWNGKAWVSSLVRRWDGRRWVTISEQTYTKEFAATWTRSYNGSNNYRGDGNKGRRLYQGRYSDPDTNWYGDKGIQKGMAGFNTGSIRKELAGAKILKVELYLVNLHWWYWAGGRVSIGTHNTDSPPSRYSEVRYNIATATWSQRGGAKWITLPNLVGENLRDNSAKGFTLHRSTTDPYYYGYFAGEGSGTQTPRLRVTYVK